jgi:CheY-like chemotaxis protein/HPt (histidine-containing phosphotransfer) domain-containing protein
MKKITLISPETARILVAEDHPLNQMFMRKSLQRFGIGYFEVVPDGLQALQRHTAEPFDLIFMDCHMPEMTGYAATKEIREIERKTSAHVLIVAMTANTMEGEREKCLACGMDEYISKPINLSELQHLLKRWLQFEDDLDVTPTKKTTWNSSAPVDVSRLRDMAEGNPALEKEMARLFVEQSEKNLATLKQSHARKDLDTLREAAHMFKGGASGIGATGLAQVCDRLEYFEGTNGGRAALIEGVGKEYASVKYYLEELGLLTA